MINLPDKIEKYLERRPDFTKEVIVQDDMIDGVSNPFIREWNISNEKPKPTKEELDKL
tara:strand:+ start:629 stop:802 length:174 start_codon:yes stop_codon:yes gene_type:complete